MAAIGSGDGWVRRSWLAESGGLGYSKPSVNMLIILLIRSGLLDVRGLLNFIPEAMGIH